MLMMQRDEGARVPRLPRRDFLGVLGGLGAGMAGAIAAGGLVNSAGTAAAPPAPLADANGSVLRRMQRELEASLASGRTPSWIMVVDTRKCIGCDACSVACRAENPTGPGGNFRRVIQRELPLRSGPWAIFKPVNCLQCEDPPCARAVPPGMVRKRPDGIVEFDYTRLRGPYAAAAARACPFNLVRIDDGRTFTESTPSPQAYEYRTFVENGEPFSRRPGANRLEGVARKCTFCSHLLDVGVLPACVTTCVGGAMYFGDAGDPGSLVREITQGRRIFWGHVYVGVMPRVIYFEEPMPDAAHIDCTVCHY